MIPVIVRFPPVCTRSRLPRSRKRCDPVIGAVAKGKKFQKSLYIFRARQSNTIHGRIRSARRARTETRHRPRHRGEQRTRHHRVIITPESHFPHDTRTIRTHDSSPDPRAPADYDRALAPARVREHQRPFFRRWVEKYLEHCGSSGANPLDESNQAPFVRDLASGGALPWQCEQAERAVGLYYEIAGGYHPCFSNRPRRNNAEKMATPSPGDDRWAPVYGQNR
jgi:hypothetical protein